MAVGPIASVMPWQNHNEENGRHRYYGEYLGFVKDRADPAKLGRVKIHVPAITSAEDVEEHWLDWCLPKSAGLNVPPLGAPVVVTFEQGYVTHGMYSHGWLTGSDRSNSAAHIAGKGDTVDEKWLKQVVYTAGGTGTGVTATLPPDTARASKPVYPYNKVYSSEGGHVLELDDTPGFARARYYHPSGTTFLFDADGSVHCRSFGAQWFEPGGDFIVALKGPTDEEPNRVGGTFKVIYPGGTGISVGASGFHATGHAVSLLGRAVLMRGDKDI